MNEETAKVMNSASYTPYPELNAILRELVNSVRSILRDDLIGAYLQGSFAVGDFDEHSDCDFAIAVNQDLSNRQIQDLRSMHRRIYNLDMRWAQALEGSYFPKAILRDHAQSGSDLCYLDNGHSELEWSNHCNKVALRWILREKGVVLFGPEPSTLIDPIPVEVLRRSILNSINESAQTILANPAPYSNRFYQTFIVLHFCRKLHSLHAGAFGSKRAGAEWAKHHLGQSWAGLIDRALSGRTNPTVSIRQPADESDLRSTMELLKEVMRAANDFTIAGGMSGSQVL
ncbi:hypothetical protein C3F09_08170 [candidate division GN15 bacterium]|uniref:DUF4111 domain-containing protein n=1 Tax=candidate division GN15 bacterium TaxID=2072418 RepID=A0A855WZD8_9BACT|nr:MAG: hypothetical protein C3F09_08170 [candidate division GN15 bacterium]